MSRHEPSLLAADLKEKVIAMQPIPQSHPLKQLFAGLVEHAFGAELGVCDPAVTDYVSDLLIDFVHMDNLAACREAVATPSQDLAATFSRWEGLEDMPGRQRERLIHRRIGDYTLFWAGIFPESVRRTYSIVGADQLQDYVNFGKRSYAVASELTPPGEVPPSILLRRLSEEFECCVHGLAIVRQELNRPGTGAGDLIY